MSFIKSFEMLKRNATGKHYYLRKIFIGFRRSNTFQMAKLLSR